MGTSSSISSSELLKNIRYEIRGELANRAHELERQGFDILSLNIGNPGLYGFKVPEAMRLAVIENLENSDAYCHQKGIFPAREAVVMQQQTRGIENINIDQVFMGNGVSELIDMTLRALLNPGDEILVPSPDYPLWSAATALNGGKPMYYPCSQNQGFQPNLITLEKSITKKTKAIVIINPNNPTGAVYKKNILKKIAQLAHQHHLVILSDEIYDQMIYPNTTFTPMASLCPDVICATFGGLSKVYRACGYRVGWVAFSGAIKYAQELLHAMDLLAALRLCSNVPGQWAVQTALGGQQSITALCSTQGRLFKSRAAVTKAVTQSPYLSYLEPAGSMYAFIGVNNKLFPNFSDNDFALRLLEEEHILLAPGTSFNVPYKTHFRITLLPEAKTLATAFAKINDLLNAMRIAQPKI